MERTVHYRLSRLLLLVIPMAGVAGCGEATGPDVVQVDQEILPVSTGAVMESLINHAADPLFAVSWGSPATEEEWQAIEQLARQLQLGGSLLPYPGTGPMDGEWAADAGFTGYARQLSASAGRALEAARSRREAELQQVGVEISAVCNSCHNEFAPGLPQIDLVN